MIDDERTRTIRELKVEIEHLLDLGYTLEVVLEQIVDNFTYPIGSCDSYNYGFQDGRDEINGECWGEAVLETLDKVQDILIDENVPVSIRNRIEGLKEL